MMLYVTIKERLGCAIESLEKGNWGGEFHPFSNTTDEVGWGCSGGDVYL